MKYCQTPFSANRLGCTRRLTVAHVANQSSASNLRALANFVPLRVMVARTEKTRSIVETSCTTIDLSSLVIKGVGGLDMIAARCSESSSLTSICLRSWIEGRFWN